MILLYYVLAFLPKMGLCGEKLCANAREAGAAHDGIEAALTKYHSAVFTELSKARVVAQPLPAQTPQKQQLKNQ